MCYLAPPTCKLAASRQHTTEPREGMSKLIRYRRLLPPGRYPTLHNKLLTTPRRRSMQLESNLLSSLCRVRSIRGARRMAGLCLNCLKNFVTENRVEGVFEIQFYNKCCLLGIRFLKNKINSVTLEPKSINYMEDWNLNPYMEDFGTLEPKPIYGRLEPKSIYGRLEPKYKIIWKILEPWNLMHVVHFPEATSKESRAFCTAINRPG